MLARIAGVIDFVRKFPGFTCALANALLYSPAEVSRAAIAPGSPTALPADCDKIALTTASE